MASVTADLYGYLSSRKASTPIGWYQLHCHKMSTNFAKTREMTLGHLIWPSLHRNFYLASEGWWEAWQPSPR